MQIQKTKTITKNHKKKILKELIVWHKSQFSSTLTTYGTSSLIQLLRSSERLARPRGSFMAKRLRHMPNTEKRKKQQKPAKINICLLHFRFWDFRCIYINSTCCWYSFGTLLASMEYSLWNFTTTNSLVVIYQSVGPSLWTYGKRKEMLTSITF